MSESTPGAQWRHRSAEGDEQMVTLADLREMVRSGALPPEH